MTPKILILSAPLWQSTLQALARYGPRRVEAACLWYGDRKDDAARALAVGIPRQVNRARNFEIPADALAELNQLMSDGLVVVAQVHSHPGSCTTHSPWDNAMMVSRKIFSLVIPHYAARPCDPAAAGIHVHDGARWIKLAPTVTQEHLRVETAETEFEGSARPLVVDAR